MTRLLLLLGCLLFAVGCGPIRSTVGIIQADQVIKEARQAGAERNAPYPMRIAEELIRKAVEEQGYADYYQSWLLAKEARKYAEEALAAPPAPEPPPVVDPPPEAVDGFPPVPADPPASENENENGVPE